MKLVSKVLDKITVEILVIPPPRLDFAGHGAGEPKLEISTWDKNRCGHPSTTRTRTNNYCNRWLSFLEALAYNEGRHT